MEKINRTKIFVVAALSILSGVVKSGELSTPLVRGGEAKYDACMSQGQIVGLDPNGDGFLSVRSGPGGKAYYEKDRLHNGDIVMICGYDHEPWLPIIYDRTKRLHCNLGPWPVRSTYTGPCPWGWVHRRYVNIFAG